jgi:hypothetical protein
LVSTGALVHDGTYISAADAATGVTFLPILGSSNNGHFTVQASLDQFGTGLSAPANVLVTVTRPIQTITYNTPVTQTAAESIPFIFAPADHNALTVAGVADPGTLLTLTLTPSEGQLALGSTVSLSTVSQTAGSFILIGTESALNTALSGLTFTSNRGYTGTADIAMTLFGPSDNLSETIALDVVPEFVVHGSTLVMTGTSDNDTLAMTFNSRARRCSPTRTTRQLQLSRLELCKRRPRGMV